MRLLWGLCLALAMTAGCAHARGQHELTDTAHLIPPVTLRPEQVQVYRDGAHPCFKVARLAAHGNGYATRDTLDRTLQEQAAAVGAAFVIVLHGEVKAGMTVGSYGGGVALADTIKTPSLYGVACRTPNVVTGVRAWGKDKDFVIQYVKKGSPADEAGLKEGDTFLTLNGHLMADDPLIWDREVYSKHPGDTVEVEYLHDGTKHSTTLTLKTDGTSLAQRSSK